MIFAIKVSDFGEDFFVKIPIFVNYYSLVLGHPWIVKLFKNLKICKRAAMPKNLEIGFFNDFSQL